MVDLRKVVLVAENGLGHTVVESQLSKWANNDRAVPKPPLSVIPGGIIETLPGFCELTTSRYDFDSCRTDLPEGDSPGIRCRPGAGGRNE
ncbi:hypothetical protein EVAR_4622_1 [Eumeta japonica]|uniref:Uncharacterized protein n=1 Tax=Eumeta variegata TaxID=151549 RepID=A0A4C1SYZ5_EUMVA|nr:hypothetical protein EVAR_4622_1 [Eumeta japonica]